MNRRWLGASLGLLVAFLLPLVIGENPVRVVAILFQSAFGSNYDLGLTLFYTTPLIFTGLSVALAFQAGLFNIGAEGQLLVGSVAAAAFGVWVPGLPPVLAPCAALLAAVIAAALYGGLAGWLRARRGSHEVIVTILLNFVAAGLTSWIVLNIIPNPRSQNPESIPVAPNYTFADIDPFARWFPDTGLSLAFPIAILLAIATWWWLRRSAWGFELRAVGQNPLAARRAGVPVERRQIQALAVAGGLAGFVSLAEVLGHSGQFRIGFSPDYGFIGIAVALLAGNNPIGVIFAAFLMGALHKGASELDMETATITRDYSKIIQALIILGVGLRLAGPARRLLKKEAA